MRNLIGSLAVVAATVVVGLPTMSFSQDPGRHGAGAFVASGSGEAVVKGDGKLDVQGRGTVVVIAGRRDDIDVQGFGFKRQDGNHFYFEGKGEIHVKGKDIGLDATGDIDKVTAGGRGTARLIGAGHFKSGRDQGNWMQPGIDVHYGRR